MTPDRANGQCRNLVECPQLLQLLRNTNRSPQQTQYLQQSMCDQIGSLVYVSFTQPPQKKGNIFIIF